METRTSMRTLLYQSVRDGRGTRQGYSNRSGGSVRFAPLGGAYRRNELDQRDRRDYRHNQADTRRPLEEEGRDQDSVRLLLMVQNAIMYLQD